MSDDWLDVHVHTRAWDAVRAHITAGVPRILLWGPRGVGRSTLLRRLVAHHAAVGFVDADDADEARLALSLRESGGTHASVVVALHTREGVDADAYVECAPLPIDDRSDGSALAFLRRLAARDGLVVEDSRALATVAAHTEGVPAMVHRAAALLRVMSVDALAARCAEALDELHVLGRYAAHPLDVAQHEPSDYAELDERLAAAAVALIAAGEPIRIADAESSLGPHALDALLMLRDRGALLRSEGDRVAARRTLARALAQRSDFSGTFALAAASHDAQAVARAQSARQRWVSHGDERALAELGEDQGRLRRAAERALRSLTHDDSAAARLVESVLALYARSEVVDGPRADGALLRRACAALGDTRLGRVVAVERAHWLRVAGRFDELDVVLAGLDPSTLPHASVGRLHIERARAACQRRDFDAAAAQLEAAAQSTNAEVSPHDEARDALELGALRYWQQRFDDALACYARARVVAARLGAKRTEAIALSNSCLCHAMVGDDSSASEHGARAAGLLRRIGDSGALGTTLGHLGVLAYQYGRLDDAERHLAEADERVEQAGYFEQRVFVRFNRACVALAAGNLSLARERLQSLPAMLVATPSAYVSAHLGRLESDLYEHEGRLAEARAALERGLGDAQRSASFEALAQLAAQLARVLARLRLSEASRAAETQARTALASIGRAELIVPVELVLEHAALLRGDASHAPTRLIAALGPAWRGLSARTRVGVSTLDSGAVRAAALLYWRDLPPAMQVEVAWAARDPEARALCLDARGERCRLPGGALLDSATRRNAHRLLSLLADAGADGCTREALIDAMWPGEQILEEAALNRLHNALAQLRAAGLGSHLVREADRYRLDGIEVLHAATFEDNR